LYWNIGFKVADYAVLLDWWSEHTYGKHLYIGQGVYRMGGKGWEDPDELRNQIKLNRNYEQVGGSMFFSAKIFLQNKNGINEQMKKIYRYPSLVPVMGWIDGKAPDAPAIASAVGSQKEGIELKWSDALATDASYYVIYRFNKGDSITLEDSRNIQATVQRSPYDIQSWTDHHTEKRTEYMYVITAVDRIHNESNSSNVFVIKTRGKRTPLKVL
jgi:hypothetical protein